MSDTTSRPTDDGMSIFSTLEAFKDGLTSTLSLPAAAAVCRGWVAKINDAERPDLNGISALLGQLADELTSDRGPQGGAIGDLMKRIGAHTVEAAPTIGDDHLVAPLKRLGAFLQISGNALQNGGRPEEIAGVSTDRDGSPVAPDAGLDPDRAGAKGLNATLLDPVVTPGDTTPGTKLSPK